MPIPFTMVSGGKILDMNKRIASPIPFDKVCQVLGDSPIRYSLKYHDLLIFCISLCNFAYEHYITMTGDVTLSSIHYLLVLCVGAGPFARPLPRSRSTAQHIDQQEQHDHAHCYGGRGRSWRHLWAMKTSCVDWS